MRSIYWIALAVALFGVTAVAVPQVAAVTWLCARIVLGAGLGYAIDLWLFRGRDGRSLRLRDFDPHVDGDNFRAASLRRAMVVSASVIGMALAG